MKYDVLIFARNVSFYAQITIKYIFGRNTNKNWPYTSLNFTNFCVTLHQNNHSLKL